MNRIIDTDLTTFAPEVIRGRLTSPEFTALRDAHLSAQSASQAHREVAPRHVAASHAAFDAAKVAAQNFTAYRVETAEMLSAVQVQEASPVMPSGVEALGQAESGSVEWLRMRLDSLGGSDVGAICKVGKWGRSNYDRVRESKMNPATDDQTHEGFALIGDLWEPTLVGIAGRVLDAPVYMDKTTYRKGNRHVNLDGFTLADDGSIDTVIECKTASEDWGDGVPAQYVLQVQHCMDVTGARSGVIVAAINDSRLVMFSIDAADQVDAGEDSPKKLGGSFCYADVRGYVEGMVSKWAKDRVASSKPVKRRRAKIETAVEQWKSALGRGVVFVDLETTTLSATTGHVLELAMIGEDGEAFHRFFGVPDDHKAWNGTGSDDVHRITVEDVDGLPVLLEHPEIVAEMAAFIDGRTLVAHNARFEESWLSEAGLVASYADSLTAFSAFVDGDHAGNTMEDLCRWAGVPYVDAHRALADTEMLRQAFGALRAVIDQHIA